MEPQARGVEATPLLRKRDDTHGGWFAGVGLFSTRRDDASGASRGARAVLALGAAAMLCVGAASTSAGKDVISSLGASSSAAAEADLTSLGGSPAVAVGQLGDDPAFEHPENIVKYPTPLPDVDFSGKTLLIVMGHPFSGTSALEGLIGTGSGVTDLCKSGTWQCEDTWLLKYMDFDIEPGIAVMLADNAAMRYCVEDSNDCETTLPPTDGSDYYVASTGVIPSQNGSDSSGAKPISARRSSCSWTRACSDAAWSSNPPSGTPTTAPIGPPVLAAG